MTTLEGAKRVINELPAVVRECMRLVLANRRMVIVSADHHDILTAEQLGEILELVGNTTARHMAALFESWPESVVDGIVRRGEQAATDAVIDASTRAIAAIADERDRLSAVLVAARIVAAAWEEANTLGNVDADQLDRLAAAVKEVDHGR